ncbi:tyrosine-protein phosphatase non-receptor type 3-like [Pomacea canaliculata]|uniref:tyrosine-protein phosphatase non-receptor type 3-like n=1 Tax=Pomacea canaliculata TaxID=400727 RepID=UPI000D734D7E|nr:tyrosine-protein phosphatase non-receptor type 3-like [Pomacea canaliculata]
MIVIVIILCLVMRKKLGHKLDVQELQERSTTRRDSESQSVYVIKKEAKKKAEVRPAFLRVPNKFGQKNGYTNFAMDEQASKAGSVSGDENGDYMVIYDNDDSIYATLKDGNAQTDNAVLSLIDSLASGELPDKYTELPKGFLHEHEAGKSPLNCNKNRVASVVPYDYNRIVLKDGYVAVEATDYINASYIQGYQDRNTYIATQGPRDNTVSDFWRMVWQEQITQIVMLANISEGGQDQCWEYWPFATVLRLMVQ